MKKKGKRFLPIFAPSYVKVIAVQENGGPSYLLQILKIDYTASEMHIRVVKP